MNRRSLFHFLTGAAAAIGVRKDAAPSREQLIEEIRRAPVTLRSGSAGQVWAVNWTAVGGGVDRTFTFSRVNDPATWGNEVRNAFVDHYSRQPLPSFASFRSVVGYGGRRDSDPDCRSRRIRDVRARVLNALDASRDARLTSRFDEGA